VTDEEAPALDEAPPLDAATVDWKGLLFEAKRRSDRAVKKVTKKTLRLSVLAESSVALHVCEEYFECDAALDEAKEERDALAVVISALQKGGATNQASALAKANLLGLRDFAPERPLRGPKKVKGPAGNPNPRMPYSTYSSAAGTEIRVGRTSADNDLLSCDARHRDGLDWWMHAAGSAGSHVVIRTHDNNFPETDRETLLDAACLALLFSKAIAKPEVLALATGRASVSLVRARDVTKPAGAVAGLVQLRGGVRTVQVDLGREHPRLERLLATKDL